MLIPTLATGIIYSFNIVPSPNVRIMKYVSTAVCTNAVIYPMIVVTGSFQVAIDVSF